MWVWLSTRPGRTVKPRRSRSVGKRLREVVVGSRVSKEVIRPEVLLMVRDMFSLKALALESKRREV